MSRWSAAVLSLLLLSGCRANEAPQREEQDYEGIAVVGNKEFIEQVQTAVTLMKVKAPNAFGMTQSYVGRIEQGPRSGMWAYRDPPTFELNDRSAFYSITWCAGSIVHDSYHSKL